MEIDAASLILVVYLSLSRIPGWALFLLEEEVRSAPPPSETSVMPAAKQAHPDELFPKRITVGHRNLEPVVRLIVFFFLFVFVDHP